MSFSLTLFPAPSQGTAGSEEGMEATWVVVGKNMGKEGQVPAQRSVAGVGRGRCLVWGKKD